MLPGYVYVFWRVDRGYVFNDFYKMFWLFARYSLNLPQERRTITG